MCKTNLSCIMQFGKIMLTINYAKQMDNIKVQIGLFFFKAKPFVVFFVSLLWLTEKPQFCLGFKLTVQNVKLASLVAQKNEI